MTMAKRYSKVTCLLPQTTGSSLVSFEIVLTGVLLLDVSVGPSHPEPTIRDISRVSLSRSGF